MSEEQAAAPEEATAARTHEVKAGEETYTIRRFKGYKAFKIGRMLAGLGEIGPEISKAINKFVAEYRETNVDKIPRATLEFRYPEEAAGVSDEAWKESGGAIELSRDPSQGEILAVVLPTAFNLAGDKVADLLAWVIADDVILEQKDDEGEQAVVEYVNGLRKKLLFSADVDQLLDLAIAARDILGEQMAGKAEAARSLLALIGLDEGAGETEPEESEPTDETPKAASPEFESEKDEMPSTPESTTTSEKPDSSTDSPPPTDGDVETSSTDQAGEPSPSISG